ncbi:unnamed protein product [Macrosiphum euphorbiae]|uniref:Uncharacterized protein n=1 Tax=Macrosiphum euphorbiae TaxID=13131 RepID=A0AAV0VNX0_9HEMI|nr:unnamed protein product [Macrosiphum euphorbiae]
MKNALIKINRQKLSNSSKRKAQEALHERPARRCSTIPTLPKTLIETHNILNNYNLMTNRGEQFLFINSAETNIIGFTCDTNLEVLRQMKTVFIDGTFKYYFCNYHCCL